MVGWKGDEGKDNGGEEGMAVKPFSVVIMKNPNEEEPFLDKALDCAKRISGDVVLFEEDGKDYSQLRNAAAEKCMYAYVFMLDADELIDPVAFKESLREFNLMPWGAWQFRRYNLWGDDRHYRMDPEARPDVDLQTRLYHRKYYHWVGEVHEQLVPRITEPKYADEPPLDAYYRWQGSGFILHYGWLRPRDMVKRIHDRYRKMQGRPEWTWEEEENKVGDQIAKLVI